MVFNPGSGTSRDPRARAQRLDVLLGILAFFTVMALVQAVVVEARGHGAVKEALVLLVLVVATGLVWRRRRGLGV